MIFSCVLRAGGMGGNVNLNFGFKWRRKRLDYKGNPKVVLGIDLRSYVEYIMGIYKEVTLVMHIKKGKNKFVSGWVQSDRVGGMMCFGMV